MNYPTYHLNTK